MTLLERYKIQGAVIDAVTAGTKTAAKKGVEESLKTSVGEILTNTVSDAAGAFFGTFASTLLKQVLGVQETMSQNLKSIQRTLTKVSKSSFETGISSAKVALTLPFTTEDERQHRDEKLKFAVDELERALTNVESESEKKYIHLIQGLCLLEKRGGRQEAFQKLGPIADEFEQEAQRVMLRMKQKHAAAFYVKSPFGGGLTDVLAPFRPDALKDPEEFLAVFRILRTGWTLKTGWFSSRQIGPGNAAFEIAAGGIRADSLVKGGAFSSWTRAAHALAPLFRSVRIQESIFQWSIDLERRMFQELSLQQSSRHQLEVFERHAREIKSELVRFDNFMAVARSMRPK